MLPSQFGSLPTMEVEVIEVVGSRVNSSCGAAWGGSGAQLLKTMRTITADAAWRSGEDIQVFLGVISADMGDTTRYQGSRLR